MIEHVILCIILFQTIEANGGAHTQTEWKTLKGGRPEVVAQGGYSGFFPDSSLWAYDFAIETSIHGTVLYCNMHFTEDNDAFCGDQINLANTTNIAELDSEGKKAYNVDGKQIQGWFGFNYLSKFIFNNVTLNQNIFTRHDFFDGAPIAGPFDIAQDSAKNPLRLWLNVENYDLYKQRQISPEAYLLGVLNHLPEFISSPEIGFLKSIGLQLGNAKVKLIFVFRDENEIEPTTGATYGSLVKNMKTIKSFASGILVPKGYVWPISNEWLLQQATSLVVDAHREGLLVYASGFANDKLSSYNYSFDPVKEYQQFVDNSQFSVDGVLSEFPSTASEAIGCLIHNQKASKEVNVLIISHNGASGDYPGSTDLAYQKAIDDGADIIDCSVQLSKDGTAFCLDSPDLTKTTTAAASFMDLSTNVPEIQQLEGIFSFDLTWSEIQSLKPQIETSFDGVTRNPAQRNSGRFVTLSEFLNLAKAKAVAGVLVSLKNVAFLSKNGVDIVGKVKSSLEEAKLDEQRVLIQSEDTSVLSAFKDNAGYEKVFYVKKSIGGATEEVALEVKKYADAVLVHRDAIIVESNDFACNFTKTISSMHAANISVYVGVIKNEFMNLIHDYLSDPYVELATLASQKVDGFVTQFPATASFFTRSSCASNGSTYMIQPIEPGLLHQSAPTAGPPFLTREDVVQSPKPSVAVDSAASNGAIDQSSSSKSSSHHLTTSIKFLIFTLMLELLTFTWNNI